MTSFRVRSCSSLPCLLHIDLTRGTGQGPHGLHPRRTREARKPQARKPSSSQAQPRRKHLKQDQAPRRSASQPAATASSASQVGCSFGEKGCLSHPDELLTSYSLPPPKRALPAYQDVVNAVRNPLEHQGRRHSFSRYLHFLEKIYPIFLHFSCTGIFSIFHGENPARV
jgi:hypothetical protein